MYVSKKDAATADLVRSAKAMDKKALTQDTRSYGKLPKPPNPLQGFALGGLVMGRYGVGAMRNDYCKQGKHSTGGGSG